MPSKGEVAGLTALLKARKGLLKLETDPAKKKIIEGWIDETEARLKMHKVTRRRGGDQS